MAQLRADKITAADEFKMYKRIELWMNVKSDDKPFFGNPNSSRALFKEAGMPDAWIDSQLRVGGFKVN
ncbi:MAG: hypothetical protein HRT88_04975 [Lentisphaeraceae bacterium]|nr:hypothetical protein [Lentisphaeraceae bacterium]